MTYTESSLAIIEYEINRVNNQRKWCDERLKELIKIRDKCIKSMQKDYEVQKQ